MPGLYLHIPFCKQACHYCNFHFSTSLKYKSEMVAALCRELHLQKDYLESKKLSTIYFGGGTPSLLDEKDFDQLFNTIHQLFSIEKNAETTLEANPDDLSLEKLQMLKKSPINRLSIGIQSFSEEDLQFMNRAHNAEEAKKCVQNAQDTGFENLTVDLIYGTPTTSDEQCAINIQTVFDYQIPHISCYCLTVEPNTALDHFVKKGKAAPVNEEQAARQFEMLMVAMKSNGYQHYEISNFALPNCYARHNTNYWFGEKYLGIGPSAHSFNGKSRQWNVAHNAQYLKAIQKGDLPFDLETLSPNEQYNEYVMTALRTMWGADLNKIEQWGENFKTDFLLNVQPFLDNQTMVQQDHRFYLTNQGRLLADNIAASLFCTS